MTEASVTTGEDDEGWETLEDDLLDDDLDIEDGDMLIDPALLKPQANVAIVSGSEKKDHSLLPLRSHNQVYDFRQAPIYSQQGSQTMESEWITNRSSPSTASTSSSAVSLRETTNKGEITMEEAGKLTICMMSVSASSLGPEPHSRKTALASTESNQWEQAMQEEYNSLLENKT
ncbi:hypothetical protein B5807_12058 [Epicoccum nigrum]|uniref:Uncharacterized protein n=1 Tax=Epicoccum nigrum TaxID=105696 RepID=A0A1Y2LGZ6_EPING|nr:hypothetical protein B5807_12058 [Epicoccum nigrum]